MAKTKTILEIGRFANTISLTPLTLATKQYRQSHSSLYQSALVANY